MSFSLLSGAKEKFHITSSQIIPDMLDSAALKKSVGCQAHGAAPHAAGQCGQSISGGAVDGRV